MPAPHDLKVCYKETFWLGMQRCTPLEWHKLSQAPLDGNTCV